MIFDTAKAGTSLVVIAMLGLLAASAAKAQTFMSTNATTTYHRAVISGVKIFYREAGPKNGPTLLLLHGFPSSSRMFDSLIPLLADHYHIVAPDYPGFGNSDAPSPGQFNYTFDHLAEIVDQLTQYLWLKSYVLYMQDYGGPVGFRLALAHPERVEAVIIQNAVSHEEGLSPLWEARRAYWEDRMANEAELKANFTSLEATRQRHLGSSPNVDRYDPNTWLDEFAFLSRPGEAEIQADLFYDYQTNLASYAKWQAWMRQAQPPMLVVWGRYDPSFTVDEASAYQRDVPKAEIHILDAGHFALEEACDEIAVLIRRFLMERS